MVETNSGLWLDQTLRTGACGTWWSASTAGAKSIGLLQLDPALVAQPATRERVAAAVAAARTVSQPGLVRTTELVIDAKRAWLVVATPPTPTVADLLAAGAVLAPGAAAGLAVDVAAALRDLHAVGLNHGGLEPDTAVLTGAGAATLVEVGLLAALYDLPADVGGDVLAWSALVRQLAAIAPESALLLDAATTAESGDLATAARRLADAAADLADFASRDALAAVVPTIAAAAARIPGQRSTVDSAEGGSAVRLRFGRGVPESAIAAAAGTAGRAAGTRPAGTKPSQTAGQRSRRAERPSQTAGKRRSLRALQIAVALTILLLGAGAALWWLLLLR